MEKIKQFGEFQRALEEQGYRVIRLEKEHGEPVGIRQAENDPELYAPIVVHNLRRSEHGESANRFEKALELRRLGRSTSEIRRTLGFD